MLAVPAELGVQERVRTEQPLAIRASYHPPKQRYTPHERKS